MSVTMTKTMHAHALSEQQKQHTTAGGGSLCRAAVSSSEANVMRQSRTRLALGASRAMRWYGLRSVAAPARDIIGAGRTDVKGERWARRRTLSGRAVRTRALAWWRA
jgi:hypothetical protein